jgi:DNA polymerase-3 subunit chi
MGAVYFYHLTRSPLEATLPVLLDKALAAGWTVAVRGRSEERIDWLDQKLWLGPEERFLPHGRAGGPHDADQPVLLTTSSEAANAPTCVMAVDGATLAAEEVAGLERACVLFDGNDPTAVDAAREQWRTLTGAGCAAQYWSQEGGGWEKKAESGNQGLQPGQSAG